MKQKRLQCHPRLSDHWGSIRVCDTHWKWHDTSHYALSLLLLLFHVIKISPRVVFKPQDKDEVCCVPPEAPNGILVEGGGDKGGNWLCTVAFQFQFASGIISGRRLRIRFLTPSRCSLPSSEGGKIYFSVFVSGDILSHRLLLWYFVFASKF